jgi:hypothetical protein
MLFDAVMGTNETDTDTWVHISVAAQMALRNLTTNRPCNESRSVADAGLKVPASAVSQSRPIGKAAFVILASTRSAVRLTSSPPELRPAKL